MIQRLRSIRPLDRAIIIVAILTIAVGGFLGWSVWSHNRSVEKATPVSRAIGQLTAAVKKKPNDVNLRMELAQAYVVSGRDRDAAEQYQQVLKLQKNNVAALSGLGFVMSKQRDWAEAENYLRRVVDLVKKQPNGTFTKQYETATFYLGNALLEQEKYEDAIGYFKESLRANRSAADTHFLLAMAYRGLEADEECRNELEIALEFDPLMPEANYEIGRLLLEDGDEASAAQHFRIAADEAPGREEPRDELERLGPFDERLSKAKALSKAEPKKALVNARVAVALEPKNAEALMLLGSLFETTKDKSSAADTYRNILTFDAQNAAAKAALERVTDDE